MSTDQTHISVVTDEVLTVGLKSWSRGQKSQAASGMCSGGVSAVMGSSDLDEHNLVSGGAPGNQLSCSLPFGADRPIVGTACRAKSLVCSDEARHSPMGHASAPGVEVMTLQERVTKVFEGD